jgi:hypothetical protein
MKIQYRIFRINYDDKLESSTLQSFCHWNDLFDTEEECMNQIKQYGITYHRYTIIKQITFE